MGRSPCCEKKGLRRGRWTIEEDEILVKYIAQKGEGSWKSLPKNAGLLRCGKSCRLRWINYLRADLKRGNISKEEEEIIIKLHSTIGNRWSLIAAQLPGRTDNEIKNYWNSHLSRSIHSFRGHSGNPTAVYDLPAGKRRGGRTSRATMKKNSTLSVKSNGSQKVKKDDNFDFNVDLQRLQTVEKEGGEELVKVMEEMEEALMADLESLEAELWEGDECEIWPWLWEMSGSDELPPEMCGDPFF